MQIYIISGPITDVKDPIGPRKQHWIELFFNKWEDAKQYDYELNRICTEMEYANLTTVHSLDVDDNECFYKVSIDGKHIGYYTTDTLSSVFSNEPFDKPKNKVIDIKLLPLFISDSYNFCTGSKIETELKYVRKRINDGRRV